MEPWIRWMAVPALIAGTPAHGVQYLTVEQARGVLFPSGTRFTARPLELDAGQEKAIQSASGQRVRDSKPRIWQAFAGERPAGWFFVDEVIGKHEFITYALAIGPEGAVRGIEVLDYRETYGGEIRGADWRGQFAGKRHGDILKLGSDIRNISGATLSCRNVTNGVKRLLAMHALVLK
jgi:Na+-translocating ferredoxin:NAD+ oxidoreductase RnfG subunit